MKSFKINDIQKGILNHAGSIVGVYLKGNFNFTFISGGYVLNTYGIKHAKNILKSITK